ncbi:MAG TPA: hypothetical protein VHB99_13175 [Pirellulales bacterium]|nr:hypothetical protein [Pirellulales bacterium]
MKRSHAAQLASIICFVLCWAIAGSPALGQSQPAQGGMTSPGAMGIGGTTSPGILYPSPSAPGSITPGPYALPPAQGLRDPLGIESSRNSHGGSVPTTRPRDIGPRGRAAIREKMTHHNVRTGVTYFPRKGMYEDAIYRPRRGSYRVQSGGRPAPQGGLLQRAGVTGDRAIDGDGIPRTLRRTTRLPMRDIGARR